MLALLEPLDLHGKTLLDVGCGQGDLVQHLPADCDYTGIDVSPTAIENAKASYPDRLFLETDELRPADIVVANAVITCTHYPPDVFLGMLCEHARDVVALSMWGPFAPVTTLLSWVPQGVGRVLVMVGHHPNDVAMWVFK